MTVDGTADTLHMLFVEGLGGDLAAPYTVSVTPGACPEPEVCDDQEDNDGDESTDCDDPDCLGDPMCDTPDNELLCNDRDDNDNDQATDCLDSDCAGDALCRRGDQAIPAQGTAFFQGGLGDVTDPLWVSVMEGCAPGSGPMVPLEVHELHNATGATQLLQVDVFWGGDGVLVLHDPAFLPTDAAGCLAVNDDNMGDTFSSRVSGFEMEPDARVWLMVTLKEPNPNPFAVSYTVQLTTSAP